MYIYNMEHLIIFLDSFFVVMCIPVITILILNKTSDHYYYQENGVVLTAGLYIKRIRYVLLLNFFILISWPVFFILIDITFDNTLTLILEILKVLFAWFLALGFLIEARKSYPHAPHNFITELKLYKK